LPLGNLKKDLPFSRDPRVTSRLFSTLGIWLAFAVSVVGSYLLWTRFGIGIFPIALGVLVFLSLFTIVSFKHLTVPFFLMVLSVGGFRTILSLQVPLMPDFYLDRILLIWLMLIFMVKFFAQGHIPRKPWRLDFLLLIHSSYILVRVSMGEMEHFNLWISSVFIPYLVYFFSKNIITDVKKIRLLLGVLLGLSIYYNITSIAEKFDINWLLWPRFMVEEHPVFLGRSTGPIRNPGIYGNALGMLLPIHLYFMATTKKQSTKIILGFSMALGFAGLYFTYTRGSWMAGLICLAVVAFFNRRHYLRTLLPLAFLVPFVSFAFLGVGQDQVMKERVENEGTIGSRVGTQVTAIRVWRDYPLFGCGSFDYARVRGDYIAPVEVPLLGTIRFTRFRDNSAHDMYLGPLAEDGLVGMGLIIAVYIIVLMTLWKKLKWQKDKDHVALFVLPLFAGIAASYLSGGLTISYRHTSILGALFFMAAGIADGYRPTLRQGQSEDQ
jgi:hypothetical protein